MNTIARKCFAGSLGAVAPFPLRNSSLGIPDFLAFYSILPPVSILSKGGMCQALRVKWPSEGSGTRLLTATVLHQRGGSAA